MRPSTKRRSGGRRQHSGARRDASLRPSNVCETSSPSKAGRSGARRRRSKATSGPDPSPRRPTLRWSRRRDRRPVTQVPTRSEAIEFRPRTASPSSRAGCRPIPRPLRDRCRSRTPPACWPAGADRLATSGTQIQVARPSLPARRGRGRAGCRCRGDSAVDTTDHERRRATGSRKRAPVGRRPVHKMDGRFGVMGRQAGAVDSDDRPSSEPVRPQRVATWRPAVVRVAQPEQPRPEPLEIR